MPAISCRYVEPLFIVTVDMVVRYPGELPGLRIPATVKAPEIVPVPLSCPPAPTETGPVPTAELPDMDSVPDAIVVPPENVLLPLSIVVPDPLNVSPPGPENMPDKLAVPDEGAVMVPPALVTRKFWLDWLPGASVRVPPANTGVEVTPMLLNDVVPPADMLV